MEIIVDLHMERKISSISMRFIRKHTKAPYHQSKTFSEINKMTDRFVHTGSDVLENKKQVDTPTTTDCMPDLCNKVENVHISESVRKLNTLETILKMNEREDKKPVIPIISIMSPPGFENKTCFSQYVPLSTIGNNDEQEEDSGQSLSYANIWDESSPFPNIFNCYSAKKEK